jgi:ZIP family zinc transporter
MSFSETALLGALAGFTIYLSLPFGRLPKLGARTRVALAFFAVGVLAFIFVDVMEHAIAVVETAVDGFKDETSSLGHAVAIAAILGGGFALGLGGLGAIENRMRAAQPLPPISGGAVDVLSADVALRQEEVARARPAHRDDGRGGNRLPQLR